MRAARLWIGFFWAIETAGLGLAGGLSPSFTSGFPRRYLVTVVLFSISAMLLSLSLTAWWLFHILRRSLSDQLKQLD